MFFFHAINKFCLDYPQALIEPPLHLRIVWPQRHSWGVCESLFVGTSAKPFSIAVENAAPPPPPRSPSSSEGGRGSRYSQLSCSRRGIGPALPYLQSDKGRCRRLQDNSRGVKTPHVGMRSCAQVPELSWRQQAETGESLDAHRLASLVCRATHHRNPILSGRRGPTAMLFSELTCTHGPHMPAIHSPESKINQSM